MCDMAILLSVLALAGIATLILINRGPGAASDPERQDPHDPPLS